LIPPPSSPTILAARKEIPTDDATSLEESKVVSDIVRAPLRRYIAIEKFRSVQRDILPLAEAPGLLTADDVFKARA